MTMVLCTCMLLNCTSIYFVISTNELSLQIWLDLRHVILCSMWVFTQTSVALCHLEGVTAEVCWIFDLYLVLSISISLSTVQRSSSAVRHRWVVNFIIIFLRYLGHSYNCIFFHFESVHRLRLSPSSGVAGMVMNIILPLCPFQYVLHLESVLYSVFGNDLLMIILPKNQACSMSRRDNQEGTFCVRMILLVYQNLL